MGLSTYQDAGPFSDVADDITDMTKTIMDGDFEDLTADDFGKTFQAISVLKGLGIPSNRLRRMGENLLDENYKGAILGSNPNAEN